MTLSVSISPILAEEFWHDLSCGRAVTKGVISPHAHLCQLATNANADWLGGLLPYVIYQQTGLVGLAVLKIVLCGTLIFGIASQLGKSWTTILGVMLFLVVVRENLDPLPALFNCFGAVGLFVFSRKWLQKQTWQTAALLFFIVIVWANVGRQSVVAVAILCSVLWGEGKVDLAPCFRQKSQFLIFVCLAMCITPRGLLTCWDSLRMLCPWLVVPISALANTQWKPLVLDFYSPIAMSFLLLSLVVFAVNSFVGSSWRFFVGFLLIQFIAWSNSANVLIAATLLMLQLADPFRKLFEVSAIEKEKPQKNGVLQPAVNQKSEPSFSPIDRLVTMVVVGFALICASGFLPGSRSRLGWGLSPQLDVRMVDAAFAEAPIRGLARCPDVRSAGILAWLRKPGIIIRDLPAAALLEGRLVENLTLFQEIEIGWRFSKRNANAKYSGWWLKLRNDKTQLLMVPNTSLELIGALEETIYKPLSLDSPVLPFGAVDDRNASDKIHLVLKQRDLINNFDWAYTLPAFGGTDWFHDWAGATLGVLDRETQLRQVRVLRAMNLDIASLRMLHQLRAWDSSKQFEQEFAISQQKQAYREQLTMGQPSLFRTLTLQSFSDQLPEIELFPATLTNSETKDEIISVLVVAVEKYVTGEIEQAINLLQGNDPEVVYMRALLKMESGQSSQSVSDFNQLAKLSKNHPYYIMARYWKSFLGADE